MTTTLMIQYQTLNWDSPPRSKGWTIDLPSGGATPESATHRPIQTSPSSTSSKWVQGIVSSRKKMTTRKTTLEKTPCRKSVTMTAIWPPRKTKNRAMAIRPIISVARVETVAKPRSSCSGRPHRAMK